jgi:hypothetical protein
LNFSDALNGNGISFPELFQVFHRENYLYNLTLNLSKNNDVLGYNRLFYVFVDRFSNRIMMPLDINLANITNFVVHNSTFINPKNPNETTVTISGQVGYYPTPFATAPVPVPDNSNIYIYYEANINYYMTQSSPDQQQYAAFAEKCAFGNSLTVDNSNCIFANPLNQSQTAVSPGGNPYYNYRSFKTQYQSGATCAAEPNSLLDQGFINSLFECNIYGLFSKQATRMGSNGNVEYCVPNFVNVTGTFTSQLVLVDVATTTNGLFTDTFTVCGTGTARVLTTYYGYPTQQPQVYTQSALGNSAPGTRGGGASLSSNEFTYSFSPNSTLSAFPIGSFALDFGAIEIPLLAAAAAAFVVISFLYRRKRR